MIRSRAVPPCTQLRSRFVPSVTPHHIASGCRRVHRSNQSARYTWESSCQRVSLLSRPRPAEGTAGTRARSSSWRLWPSTECRTTTSRFRQFRHLSRTASPPCAPFRLPRGSHTVLRSVFHAVLTPRFVSSFVRLPRRPRSRHGSDIANRWHLGSHTVIHSRSSNAACFI